jgi:hypothetical protein
MLSPGVVGAHAGCHYLPALGPKGNWVVSTFLSDASQRDPYEIWVYTQSDNPRTDRLCEPKRNPPWNAGQVPLGAPWALTGQSGPADLRHSEG